MKRWWLMVSVVACWSAAGLVCGQGTPPAGVSASWMPVESDAGVPPAVDEIYAKGCRYLADNQDERGRWAGGGRHGPGADAALATLVWLASGEDPVFGPYAGNVKRGVRVLIEQQDAASGIYGSRGGQSSMYVHGFAMLAVAEAYGAIDEDDLGADRSLGRSLELAVGGAVKSQKKNRYGGWRYGANATDADTSVAGAVMMGLLAARNAGVAVPDEAIDRGVAYFESMTGDSGTVAYSGMGGMGQSLARSSIANLVYAVSRRRELPQHAATTNYLTDNLMPAATSYVAYTRYYRAQALFQSDIDAWATWNRELVDRLVEEQRDDGRFRGDLGQPVDTALTLLALALNYRFLPIYER